MIELFIWTSPSGLSSFSFLTNISNFPEPAFSEERWSSHLRNSAQSKKKKNLFLKLNFKNQGQYVNLWNQLHCQGRLDGSSNRRQMNMAQICFFYIQCDILLSSPEYLYYFAIDDARPCIYFWQMTADQECYCCCCAPFFPPVLNEEAPMMVSPCVWTSPTLCVRPARCITCFEVYWLDSRGSFFFISGWESSRCIKKKSPKLKLIYNLFLSHLF